MRHGCSLVRSTARSSVSTSRRSSSQTRGRGATSWRDNPGGQKGRAVRQPIPSAGAKLFFLPKYSPDLNPIEQVFAKLKTLLRQTDPRTIEQTWRGIGNLLDH